MKRWYTLPLLAVLAGAAGFFLRGRELDAAFDPETGLATLGPWSFGLMALLAAVVLLAGAALWTLRPDAKAVALLRPRSVLFLAVLCIAAGLSAAAGGMAIKEFLDYLAVSNLRDMAHDSIWTVSRAVLGLFALGACPAMVLMGARAFRGTPPRGRYSASVLAPGFLCCAWLVTAYQRRSGDPTALRFALPLLAIIMGAAACYFMAGLSYDTPRPRVAAFSGLLAVGLCTAALAERGDAVAALLYASMGLYLLANVTALLYSASLPVPEPEPEPESVTEESTHEE